jgi:hypothetical protein
MMKKKLLLCKKPLLAIDLAPHNPRGCQVDPNPVPSRASDPNAIVSQESDPNSISLPLHISWWDKSRLTCHQSRLPNCSALYHYLARLSVHCLVSPPSPTHEPEKMKMREYLTLITWANQCSSPNEKESFPAAGARGGSW